MIKNNRSIIFEDCVLVERNLYYVARDVPILFMLDIDTNKVSPISKIPMLGIEGERVCSSIQYYNKKLFLMPMRTKLSYIWIYNLNTQGWEYIDISEDNDSRYIEKYSYSCIWQDKLILVGCNKPTIVVVDLLTGMRECSQNIFPDDNFYHASFSCAQMNDELYIPSPRTNRVYKYNISSGEVKEYAIGSEENTYIGIVWVEPFFWIAPYKGNCIIKWSGEREYVEYQIPEDINEYVSEGISTFDRNIIVNGSEHTNGYIISAENPEKIERLDKSYIVAKWLNKNTYLKMDYNGIIELFWEKEKEILNSCMQSKYYDNVFQEFAMDKTTKISLYPVSERKLFSLEKFLKYSI